MRSRLKLVRNVNHKQGPVSSSMCYPPSLEYCVGEASIGEGNPPPPFLHYADYPRGIAVIALSSPHRKEAFSASQEILEEVKQKAQIWKREYYVAEDQTDAEWRENWKGALIRQAMVALIKRIDGKDIECWRRCLVVNHSPSSIIFSRPSILSRQNRRPSSQVAPQTR